MQGVDLKIALLCPCIFAASSRALQVIVDIHIVLPLISQICFSISENSILRTTPLVQHLHQLP